MWRAGEARASRSCGCRERRGSLSALRWPLWNRGGGQVQCSGGRIVCFFGYGKGVCAWIRHCGQWPEVGDGLWKCGMADRDDAGCIL